MIFNISFWYLSVYYFVYIHKEKIIDFLCLNWQPHACILYGPKLNTIINSHVNACNLFSSTWSDHAFVQRDKKYSYIIFKQHWISYNFHSSKNSTLPRWKKFLHIKRKHQIRFSAFFLPFHFFVSNFLFLHRC